MKLTVTFLFCVILTLQSNGADGKLSDLFGKIHDSVHGTAKKVQQDVNTLFHPEANKQQENTDESSKIHFVDDDTDSEIIFDNSEAAAAAARGPVSNPELEASGTTNESATNSSPLAPTENATTLAPTENATTAAPTTTTERGRENFKAGCIAGYMRTPDGRCKPTF